MSVFTDGYLKRFYRAHPDKLEQLRHMPLDEPSARWLAALDQETTAHLAEVGAAYGRLMIGTPLHTYLDQLDKAGTALVGVAEMHTTPIAKCERGSGSNERSGAHSHWCRLWVAP